MGGGGDEPSGARGDLFLAQRYHHADSVTEGPTPSG